jgi:enoyl-[acyl-carrier protein] reductase III
MPNWSFSAGVNCRNPALTVAAPKSEQLLAEYARRAPAGPTLTTEDVANGVYLLCLPEAAMITGHTLVVDGGYCISG